MTRDEMDKLGWDECDIILVTGDAYVDHPSFGMAIVGRLLEAQGFVLAATRSGAATDLLVGVPRPAADPRGVRRVVHLRRARP